MVMPSASLTLADKVLIWMGSGTLFAVSSLVCGRERNRIRAIGISSFPLGIALFYKYNNNNNNNEHKHKHKHKSNDTVNEKSNSKSNSKSKQNNDRNEDKRDGSDDENPQTDDPLRDHPSSFLQQKCLVASVAQLVCGVSGLFDCHANTIVKATVVLRLLMTVQDSIETRPMVLHQNELQRKRDRLSKLESALFWESFLPPTVWRLRWLGFEAAVADATAKKTKATTTTPTTTTNTTTTNTASASASASASSGNSSRSKKLLQGVKATKNLVRGKRGTAVEDLIWGSLQIAYVVFDATAKQAIGTAFLVYLCTFLEDVLVVAVEIENPMACNRNHKLRWWRKIKWVKISWILVCLYLNGRWFLSVSSS